MKEKLELEFEDDENKSDKFKNILQDIFKKKNPKIKNLEDSNINKTQNTELKKDISQKTIWKKYITSQSKILEYKSKPIGIDPTKKIQIDGLKLHLSIDQEIFKQTFKKEVEQIFNLQDFDFNSGYIQTSIENTANKTTEKLTELKDLAEICYITFNEYPVVEGYILPKPNNSKNELINIIRELQTDDNFIKSGNILLTLDEWKKIQLLKNIKFEKKTSARFNINPSAQFICKSIFKIQYFQNELDNLVTLEDLPNNVFEYLNKNINLNIKSITLKITSELASNLKILLDLRNAFLNKTKFFSNDL